MSRECYYMSLYIYLVGNYIAGAINVGTLVPALNKKYIHIMLYII